MIIRGLFSATVNKKGIVPNVFTSGGNKRLSVQKKIYGNVRKEDYGRKYFRRRFFRYEENRKNLNENCSACYACTAYTGVV